MPRHSLGQNKTAGTTAKLEVRVPAETRAAAELVLRDGETLSDFVRAAMAAEVKRRRK